MEIVAQIFGIIGMIFNLLVFQQKTHKGVTMCQFFAAAAFCANYLMLGAFVGGILNLVGALRALVFFFKEKTKANSVVWLIIFILAFSASYPLTFFAFDTEPTTKNLIIELLPVVAMVIITVSLRLGSAKAVRFMGLFSSPMWLVYNAFSGSIGAIASEILNLISMIIGIIRLDIKGKNQKTLK
ncbi:MAG: YgjV family protein [Ruminococcaceae bacterium]|nr:YgjV family protein [Oscillospiraceae bacterium]